MRLFFKFHSIFREMSSNFIPKFRIWVKAMNNHYIENAATPLHDWRRHRLSPHIIVLQVAWAPLEVEPLCRSGVRERLEIREDLNAACRDCGMGIAHRGIDRDSSGVLTASFRKLLQRRAWPCPLRALQTEPEMPCRRLQHCMNLYTHVYR